MKSTLEVRRYVETKLDELRFGMFNHPPSDFVEFTKRVGMYQALSELLAELKETTVKDT